jgi:7,8-dihydroneopterin aldolase/epimerase/oxygenase
MTGRITISDLEVQYNVGVTDEERSKPQKLLITLDMAQDFTSAAISDRIEKTIDYAKVADALVKMGESRSWKLLERLASNIADFVLLEFRPISVTVEVKKFTVPQARHVAVSVTKQRG